MDSSLVQDLVKQIEVKDSSTAAHTWRVVLYARALAEAFGLDRDVIHRVTHAAALHDVGKLEIPDQILQKPGPLTPEERAVIQTHSDAGWRWLRAMGETDALVLGLVRHHHERMDGTGYPDRLAGDQIPLAARNFAVIDTFDALTSFRPYRNAVSEEAAEQALKELESKAGAWYCPDSVAAFARLYRSGDLVWIHQHYNDGSETLPAYGSTAVTVPGARDRSAAG